MATWRRRPPKGQTIAHSDHGSGYTSWLFGRRLREAGLLGSMGSIGDAYDNSVAEAFLSSLQRELLDQHRWDTRDQLAQAIFEWIETWYNPRRRHSYCDGLSPLDYETATAALSPTHQPSVGAWDLQGERVLDMGCGKGALALRAARTVGTTGLVVGIDASSRMVQSLASAASDASLGNVQVRTGDVQSPVDLPGLFDVVAASLVLFFVPQPGEALRSWRELLHPGGRLGLATFDPQDDTWRHVDDVFTRFLPAAMLDARVTGSTGPFASDHALEQLVRAAGFVDVATATIDIPVRFRDADHWFAFTMSTGQRAMWAAVPENERHAVRREAEVRLEPARNPGGGYTVHQEVRYTLGRR